MTDRALDASPPPYAGLSAAAAPQPAPSAAPRSVSPEQIKMKILTPLHDPAANNGLTSLHDAPYMGE